MRWSQLEPVAEWVLETDRAIDGVGMDHSVSEHRKDDDFSLLEKELHQ